jgi:hypothetical protein
MLDELSKSGIDAMACGAASCTRPTSLSNMAGLYCGCLIAAAMPTGCPPTITKLPGAATTSSTTWAAVNTQLAAIRVPEPSLKGLLMSTTAAYAGSLVGTPFKMARTGTVVVTSAIAPMTSIQLRRVATCRMVRCSRPSTAVVVNADLRSLEGQRRDA